MSRTAYSPEEVAAIGDWLRDGLTSAQIAAELSERRGSDVSRGKIIGLVFRNKDLKAIGFARARGVKPQKKAQAGGNAPAMAVTSASAPTPTIPPQAARDYDAGACRLPLIDLRAGQCRFPVNDAAPGEAHLFCGMAAAEFGPYCRHHAIRSTRAAEAARW